MKLSTIVAKLTCTLHHTRGTLAALTLAGATLAATVPAAQAQHFNGSMQSNQGQSYSQYHNGLVAPSRSYDATTRYNTYANTNSYGNTYANSNTYARGFGNDRSVDNFNGGRFSEDNRGDRRDFRRDDGGRDHYNFRRFDGDRY